MENIMKVLETSEGKWFSWKIPPKPPRQTADMTRSPRYRAGTRRNKRLKNVKTFNSDLAFRTYLKAKLTASYHEAFLNALHQLRRADAATYVH